MTLLFPLLFKLVFVFQAVQIHPSYEVYTLKNILDKALNLTKSASICCRLLIDHVYTAEALRNSSAFGYPPRGKGSNNVTQAQVLPRLDPNGLDAIIGMFNLFVF